MDISVREETLMDMSWPERLSWAEKVEAADSKGRVLEDINPYAQAWLDHEAGNWPTCACGQAGRDIKWREGNPSSGPEDPSLYELGLEFAGEVGCSNWSAARELIDRIEQRVRVLAYTTSTEENDDE